MRKLFLFAIFLALFLGNTHAQNANINPASVNVDALSDAQIAKIVKEMEKNGASMEEAMALARARGASQAQIDKLVVKIREYKNGKRTSSDNDNAQVDVIEPEEGRSEKKAFAPTEKNLKVFGFQFFNSENLSFEPAMDMPVSESYSLGVGDELNISVYGASQQTYQQTVQKSGSVVIPDLGPIYVYGLPIKEVKEKIKARLTSIYNGMGGNSPNTFVEISLGLLKGINVNVIGEVNLPGTYSLPATASAFNALYLAGGPNENGSFRKIDVLRDGKLVNSIDVYAYLIDGAIQNNSQLRDQDVILVRPYAKRVKIAGEFKRTGLFEAQKEETVADILRFAGGFTDKAYTHRLELYRNNTRTLSFRGVLADHYDQVPLMNGDSLVAGKLTERFENRVSIGGAVYRPGNYELVEGLKLSALIQKAEGLKEEAFMERAVITRKLADMSLKVISFSLRDVLNGIVDFDLKREDRIQISSKFDMREARTVEIVGEVQFAGTYAWAENLRIGDLIFQAGGFKEEAEVAGLEVSRVLDYEETSKLTKSLLHTFQFSLDRNLKLSAEDEAFVLKPFDKVYVRRAPGFRPQGVANVQGEVKYSGDYGITRKDEKISDVIKRAGGITPEAYVKGASLRRRIELSEAEYQAKMAIAAQDTTMVGEDIEKVSYQIVGIDLAEVMKRPGGVEDLQVKAGDQILIPSKLETVMVSGSVLSPVAHTFTAKKKLKDYIYGSGGFAQRAKKGKVYVLYANGTTEATKCGLFGRRFPKVEPGCEIIVPEKPEVDKATQASKWLAIASTFATLITAIAVATR
ncbi:SLBB domain-containing protein [Labilibaculum sp. DW002]|uniref:SLBB domain-containing protein n=1 Tax=Paralabilibaculum antarcticum TaxID=2912572 RepID=A0ABT5VP72_9BACT|nr:SLBB domain-containing protein [Labilibaculum sp. DW002]MDE5417235.1 SLBB domain-containing protein [Labilibaculum sp. DW002]